MIGSVNNSSFDPSASTNHKDGKEEKVKHKKQFVSQVEGGFYCTYLIDEKGNKILINRMPVNQMEKEDNISPNDSDFEKIKRTIFHKINNSTNFEANQQATMEATCKSNTQEIMEMLKTCAGIPKRNKM